MANPKKRKTKCRVRTKRAHDAIKKLNLVECPKCKSLTRPHRMCDFCKNYNGKTVIVAKPKAVKETPQAETKEEKK